MNNGKEMGRRCDNLVHPDNYFAVDYAWTNSDNGNCCWWLRSPGDNLNFAAVVFADGFLGDHIIVYVVNVAVRPALWIDLESVDF